ncbi:MAG: YgaP family membrane protein [Acidobacteriaceae bacterium]
MKNEGTADRVIRVVVGMGLLCLLFLLHVHGTKYWIGWLGLIGLVPLLTGLLGVCPMYSLLGIRTCKISEASK